MRDPVVSLPSTTGYKLKSLRLEKSVFDGMDQRRASPIQEGMIA
jgi:hypothetical protein